MKTLGLHLLAITVGLVLATAAPAAVQTSYDIVEVYSENGFSASWLHSGTAAVHGGEENGARMSGKLSSRVGGTLSGLFDGTTLNALSGEIQGTLKQLSTLTPIQTSFQTAFGGNLPDTSDAFVLRVGSTAGGDGALTFETTGAGTSMFNGGFLDYRLLAADASSDPNNFQEIDAGTFFFKPQAADMNKGNAQAFSLWGNNWQHDFGTDRATALSFLESLGYSGGLVDRSGVAPLGIDLYAVLSPQAVPELSSVLVWLGGAVGGCLALRSRFGNFFQI